MESEEDNSGSNSLPPINCSVDTEIVEVIKSVLDKGNSEQATKPFQDNEVDNSCEGEMDNEDPNANVMEDYSDSGDSEDDEFEEIDFLLEEGLSKSKQDNKPEAVQSGSDKRPKKSDNYNGELIIKKIVLLEEKGGNTFEVLPGGWIQIRHNSGLPLYLHRPTRVCTMAKPYFLGTASVRRHSIPLSAIPCLAYSRALEKERLDKELLEQQVRDFEKNHSVESNQEETPVAAVCPHKKDSKPIPQAVKTVAEKLKQIKRKRELGVEPEYPSKREKVETTICSQSDQQSNETNDSDISSEKSTTTAVSSLETKDEKTKENKDGLNAVSQTPAAGKVGPNPKNDAGSKNANQKAGIRALIPLAKVETARENAHLYSITPLKLREYCKPLFRFTEVECKRFTTWSARRKHTKEQKKKQLERPTLPNNAQVIKFFDLGISKGGEEQIAKKFNDYVFNPNGKSSVCILHEFVQHALRKQPTYAFQELENAATPYAATVIINEVPYGRGYGSSKKTAKAEAAKATLEILVPQMKGQLNGNRTDTSSDFDITQYFQQVDMSDVRIPKMCTSVSEPSPYTLLLTCLQRNFGQSGSNNVKFEMMPADPAKGNPPNQFKMIAGNHSVVVNASNKREGKQLASQLLLSEIHPHITNFGAFIKMYGNGSIKSVKEKKQEEQQITTLQSKASANSPNWAILNKLRTEMLKLSMGEDKDGKPGDKFSTAGDKTPLIISDTGGSFGESYNPIGKNWIEKTKHFTESCKKDKNTDSTIPEGLAKAMERTIAAAAAAVKDSVDPASDDVTTM